jgi:ATP synthase protein I
MVRAAFRTVGIDWIRSSITVSAARPKGMAEDTGNEGKDSKRLAEEAALSARLQRLGNRLAQTNRPSENGSGPRQTADPSAIARGFRLSTELVAGVLVGAAIGWLLDRWLGISPWGLIVFLLLGFVAGVLNVMRAAGVVRDRQLND